MRWFTVTLAALVAGLSAPAQDAKQETVNYVLALQDPATGGFKVAADGKPSLRACNGGVKILRALGQAVPQEEKVKAFVVGCYDKKAGSFAEPGGKPDVAINAVGLLIAVELALPKQQFLGALNYLRDSAKTFEEVRIAAAAVEAWGVSDCPFPLDMWVKAGRDEYEDTKAKFEPKSGGARLAGSYGAMILRLGLPLEATPEVTKTILAGVNADGGWGLAAAKSSDLETTYRVARALRLAKPDAATAATVGTNLRPFLAKCRNKDGGYGVKPGDPSTMSGTYYAVIVEKFLTELGK